MSTCFEGESLVNDASALVIYKVAVAAAIGGSFSVAEAGLRFLLVAAGGLAIGLLAGYLIAGVRRRTEDPTTEITISLFSGYAAFLPADQIGAGTAIADAALVSALVILTRLAWSFGVTAIIRALDRRPQQRERRASWRLRVVAA